MMGPALREGYW